MNEYDVGQKHLVFVYGTLRTGYGNNRLLVTARRLGDHLTDPKYTMYNTGRFPYVAEGGKQAITGEVWQVTGDVLRNLDGLEGHPDFYCRKQDISTKWGDAWIYLLDGSDNCPIIESGDWSNK